MNKKELIYALKVRRKLCYERYFEAAKRWEENMKLFGDAGHIIVRMDAEKMECENARIEEVNTLIHIIEELED